MSDYLERIKNLNDKYTGKTVWNCDYLGTWINFDFDYVTFCCSRTNKHTMDNPPICDVGEIKNGHFDKKLFYERLLDAYENNQQGIGPCIGCKHLEKTEFKGIKPNNSIEHVSYNNYRGCNARCVYCFQEKQELIEPYKAYEVVEELYAQNMLAPNMSVDFGGGEPTILRDFEKYLDAADRHGWNISISTSAILFSKHIALGLEKGVYSVHISPDAGTQETYQKIKGQPVFKRVWENINEYCKLSEKVFVRYILSSMNSSKREIDRFIDMCEKNNVKNVVISAEHEAVRGINDRIWWHYGEDEYKANQYMAKECMKHGFATHIYLAGMSEENEKRVLNQLVNEGIKELIGNAKLFVFGIGDNGKRLIAKLIDAGAVISGFIDNYVRVEGNEYYGVRQVEYSSIDKENDVILISPGNYRKIEDSLIEYGYKKVYKLYLD